MTCCTYPTYFVCTLTFPSSLCPCRQGWQIPLSRHKTVFVWWELLAVSSPPCLSRPCCLCWIHSSHPGTHTDTHTHTHLQLVYSHTVTLSHCHTHTHTHVTRCLKTYVHSDIVIGVLHLSELVYECVWQTVKYNV